MYEMNRKQVAYIQYEWYEMKAKWHNKDLDKKGVFHSDRQPKLRNQGGGGGGRNTAEYIVGTTYRFWEYKQLLYFVFLFNCSLIAPSINWIKVLWKIICVVRNRNCEGARMYTMTNRPPLKILINTQHRLIEKLRILFSRNRPQLHSRAGKNNVIPPSRQKDINYDHEKTRSGSLHRQLYIPHIKFPANKFSATPSILQRCCNFQIFIPLRR